MSEVSCNATAVVIQVLERRGIDTTGLADGLPVSLRTLREGRGMVDWETFAHVLSRVEARTRGILTLEQLGRELVHMPAWRRVARLASYLFGPGQLLHIIDRFFGPSLFPLVRHAFEPLPDGRYVVSLGLPPELVGSEAFFRISHGTLTAFPRLFDLPFADVDAEVTPRHAVYTVTMPTSRTPWRHAGRAARTLLRLPRALPALLREQEASVASIEGVAHARRRFETVIARLPDGVVLLRAGVVVYANAALLRLLGYERGEEIVGATARDFVAPQDRAQADRMLRPSMSASTPGATELKLRHRDGPDVTCEVTPVQVLDFEGGRATLVLVRDVTERRRLEQQLVLAERMASLGTIAAGVAHEINNPLAYASLGLHNLARELATVASDLDDAVVERLERALSAVQDGTRRVRTIVSDLRTFGQPDDESVGPVDPHDVVESAIAMAGKELQVRAEVIREYRDAPFASASEARLGQVLLNLLVNAAQAMPDRPRRENRIVIRTGAAHDGYVRVEVEDNGCGMPREQIERVFDPFFTTKPRGTGTGLGLAICHRIVTQLGGRIEIESAPDEGTRVGIELPPAPRVFRTTVPRHELANAPRRRVLIVDDEPTLVSTLRDTLGVHHEVVVAHSGADALACLAADGRFDAIVCDLMMPDVGGREVYERLSTRDPELARRMIFMTGGACTPAARRFVASVPNATLEKPFDPERLFALLTSPPAAAPDAARAE